jgi:histone-lysine N-methyltransferase SETMAR
MCESGDWFLLHDNTPSHNVTVVKQFLSQRKVTVLDHPPYSPDLAPANYFLFPKVKSHLKGRLFDSISDIQKLYERAYLCVQLEGMYVEN